MKILKNKLIADDNIFFIAEIGLNHNGSLSKALKMIDFAKDAGCNAVKFQTLITSEVMLKNTKLISYQKSSGAKNMKNLIDKYNFSFEKFVKIKRYCDSKKIIFLSTPFDPKSAAFLNSLNVKAFKISSGDLNNFLLLKTIKKFKKPIILSTGMSRLPEIINTLKFLKLSKEKLAILHCVSDYPTKVKNTYLSNINSLIKLNKIVGFSDHTTGTICAAAAISMGAKIIEKHITLNSNLTGPDHKSSLECKNLKSFVENLRGIAFSSSRKIRNLTKQEKSTVLLARKSLYYNNNFLKGKIIISKDLSALRPFENGLSPSEYKKIINRKLKKKVHKFKKVSLKDFDPFFKLP